MSCRGGRYCAAGTGCWSGVSGYGSSAEDGEDGVIAGGMAWRRHRGRSIRGQVQPWYEGDG